MRTLSLLLLAMMTASCAHPMVRYHKARLLDPMMDPAKTSGLLSGISGEPMRVSEKAGGDAGGAIGNTCPTCGG